MRDYIDIVRSLLLENDYEHGRVLQNTGFWGSQAAGCIIMARDTKRFLLCHRSENVLQPFDWGGWGGWGGAIDSREDPATAVKREVHEETGYSGPFLDIVPLYMFTKETRDGGMFRYLNFLFVVEKEFKPRLNWESCGADWFEYGDWPEPLHFGLIALFNDQPSILKIKHAMQKEPK
jgi:8-oxo-dGTP pyrophosphatase MutT (NUDIX family)